MEKPEIKIEEYQRKAVFAELKQFCYFAGDHDFIEVCQWENGEGFDVEVNGKHIERFQLTSGEFRALKKLVKKMNNYEPKS